MKDLKYWKNNCEKDYLHTPISVLKYINKLEDYHKEKQRELLQCFCKLANITHDTVNKDIEDAINIIKNK
tara:strand:- start:87 stop:296 length:210 start_codon:yes stop_codon:yes gene_type:complete